MEAQADGLLVGFRWWWRSAVVVTVVCTMVTLMGCRLAFEVGGGPDARSSKWCVLCVVGLACN